MRDVWGGWHQTTVPLPGSWSTAWGLWDHTDKIFGAEPAVASTDQFDNIPNTFGIPADAIEPLAYHDENAPVPFFMFAAEGRYYNYDGEDYTLWAYEGEFAGHDDFLARHVNEPNWPICGQGTRIGDEWLIELYEEMAEHQRKVDAGECELETLTFDDADARRRSQYANT